MSSAEDRAVVLAVKDPQETRSALAYAAGEALRTGSALRLLHVVHAHPVDDAEMVDEGGVAGPARTVLATMAEQVRASYGPEITVTCEVVPGPVVDTIVRSSDDAGLVVLAGESRTGLVRLFTSWVRDGVAARSRCPVVCVPPDWSPPQHRREIVVAGMADAHHTSEPVRRALEIAAARSSRVRVVHAVWFIEPLDDLGLSPRTVQNWTRVAEDAMRAALADDLAAYPDLDVAVVAVHESPADALVRESELASMVVLGRRDPKLPRGSHLGPTARAALRHAAGPVMLVE